MSDSFITQLDDPNATFDGSEIGPKAANLATVHQAGFLIPRGFCLRSTAYRDYLASDNTADLILDHIEEANPLDSQSLQHASEKITAIFEAIHLSESVTNEVTIALRQLNEPVVAVRSSATFEDLSNASFAGIYDTYLNVSPDAEVMSAIRRCWASVWSARAIQYRFDHRINPLDVAMAVIVQAMVQADNSGVVFTQNPVSGSHRQIIVNSAKGIGSSIVDGTISPDSAVLRRRDVSMQSAFHSRLIERPAKRRWWSTMRNRAPGGLGKLSWDVAVAALQLERVFGRPQDVEWAEICGQLYILQSRPVTTFRRKAPPEPLRAFREKYLEFMYDYFPETPYHFDRSVSTNLVTIFNRSIAHAIGAIPPDGSEALLTTQDDGIDMVARLPKLSLATPFIALRRLPRTMRSFTTNPEAARLSRAAGIDDEIHMLSLESASSLDNGALLELIEQCMLLRDNKIHEPRGAHLVAVGAAMLALPAAIRTFRIRDSGTLYAAVRPGPTYPSARMGLLIAQIQRELQMWNSTELEVLAAKSTNELLERLLNGQHKHRRAAPMFQELFTQFGCRSSRIFPLPSVPTWAESPELILSVLASLASVPIPENDHNTSDTSIDILSAVDRSVNRVHRILGIRRILTALVRRNQEIAAERDSVLYWFEQINAIVRNCMLESGLRLAASSTIRRPSDIVYLTLREAAAALQNEIGDEFAALVQRRRAARPASLVRWKVRHLPSGRTNFKAGRLVLKGLAASGGSAQGAARILTSPQESARLAAGDILVCATTNPAWTPLFTVASGLVTDIGGVLSHAAILARECGIPAVLDSRRGTQLLRDGEIYIVDGSRGKVWKV